ncbi:unnamed protein product [Owenia fusiformis]|uniref:Uncharacterized protein n=1 Tax=Owenia fusiformis TaxID=6347 RepID=A0A8J1YAJ0_OWEFU|nr:unnamed protein product [Owenia fusiformis]
MFFNSSKFFQFGGNKVAKVKNFQNSRFKMYPKLDEDVKKAVKTYRKYIQTATRDYMKYLKVYGLNEGDINETSIKAIETALYQSAFSGVSKGLHYETTNLYNMAKSELFHWNMDLSK